MELHNAACEVHLEMGERLPAASIGLFCPAGGFLGGVLALVPAPTGVAADAIGERI